MEQLLSPPWLAVGVVGVLSPLGHSGAVGDLQRGTGEKLEVRADMEWSSSDD